jgi:hypothetical protein
MLLDDRAEKAGPVIERKIPATLAAHFRWTAIVFGS